MNRRAFFATLAGATAVAADPERLLWTPGKLISIPAPRQKPFMVTLYPMAQLHSRLHAQYLAGLRGELVTGRGIQYWVATPHLKPGDRFTIAGVHQ